MNYYPKCEVLLRDAEEDGFVIRDIIPGDVTLQAVEDLDSVLESGRLKEDDVAGIIVLSINGTVNLAASGPNRGFKVERKRKEEFKDSLDASSCNKSKPSRVKNLVNLGTVSFVEGSTCSCTHNGMVVNICSG